MSISRRLSEAAQAVDELYSDPAAAAEEYKRFQASLRAQGHPAAPSDSAVAGAGLTSENMGAEPHTGQAAADERVTRSEPGLLIVDRDLNVVSLSPSAHGWLVRLSRTSTRAILPDAVAEVARRVRDGDVQEPLGAHTVRQLPDGTLTEIQAWTVPQEDGSTAIAVSLSVAGPSAATDYLLDKYNLTQRQKQVAHLMLMGLSMSEIAQRLYLQESTVMDHARRIFDKAGCRSRREFTTEVFTIAYLTNLFGEPVPPAQRDRLPSFSSK